MHVQQILTLVQSRSRATARARNEYNAAQQLLNYVHRCQHRLTDGAGCGEKAYFEGRDHVLPFYTNVAGPSGEFRFIECAIPCPKGCPDWRHLPVDGEWRFVCLRCGLLKDSGHYDWTLCAAKKCFICKTFDHLGQPCLHNNWAEELYRKWGTRENNTAFFQKKTDNGKNGPHIPEGMQGGDYFSRPPFSSSSRASFSGPKAPSSPSQSFHTPASGSSRQSRLTEGRGYSGGRSLLDGHSNPSHPQQAASLRQQALPPRQMNPPPLSYTRDHGVLHSRATSVAISKEEYTALRLAHQRLILIVGPSKPYA